MLVYRVILATFILIGLTASGLAADVAVVQLHTQFDVDTITIRTGDTVVFQNRDDFMHNIQIINSNNDVADKGSQKTGVDIKYTFTDPGVYRVRCSLHPQMQAVITVE